MSYGERCLLVHGHFYQPPRENPWTGQIDPQFSASPWENWNRRIADECYIPMARSRVYNETGEIIDLYNNYAHTSFNFGPTLLSWLATVHPGLIRHLSDALVLDRTFAMAQGYSHMILPLADARDRHTQILWGLREFHHRFGFYPEGMWLPECGIDKETLRALVDHGIRFTVLSPHQASKARPFGQREWSNVAMGAIDTRRAYRLYDTDGAGRTHFDRHLDVIFYTPGLNLKVSFEHILNRPEDLARELESCYHPEYEGAQLVSIVTDGEIYGHHEKRGEEALSRLFRDIAPSMGLKVVSAWEFIRDNPPTWEVKLWDGEDAKGSSWSCEHGVGRWFRNCGCHPPTPPGWNQEWRAPLRNAFDLIRDRVRETARRELGGLLWDVDDAFADYVFVVLDPSPGVRQEFILRHCQRPLELDDVGRLWSILEALHNAMLMYASCGWFFDELSGLGPVQNMRYALRAAELVQPYREEDLASLLERELAKAKPNIQHYGDGGRVFRELVMPSRHNNQELAAAMAVCLAGGFPLDGLSWQLVKQTETVSYVDSDGNNVSWGSFVCLDKRLDRFIKTSWVARVEDFDNAGVGLHGYEEVQGDPARQRGEIPLTTDTDFSWLKKAETEIKGIKGIKRQEFLERLEGLVAVVGHDRLPEVVRGMLYRKFSGAAETMLLEEAAALGTRAVPFLSRAHRHGARVPDPIIKTVSCAFEQEIALAVYQAITVMDFSDGKAQQVERPREAARQLGLDPSLDMPYNAVFRVGMELFHWLAHLPRPGWFEALEPVDLQEGGVWLCPRSQFNHDLRYPAASELALSLGRGMAGLWSRLKEEAEPGRAAMRLLPSPELCAYAERLILSPRHAIALGIAYWDFLDKPLARLIKPDPVGIMAGEEGDRVRRLGKLLGFSPETVEKRILVAMQGGVNL